ncbi:MAG: hypothetical protein AVDCRST_MAG10-402, partial [uncultured Acidimicrobiales bacterium]
AAHPRHQPVGLEPDHRRPGVGPDAPHSRRVGHHHLAGQRRSSPGGPRDLRQDAGDGAVRIPLRDLGAAAPPDPQAVGRLARRPLL